MNNPTTIDRRDVAHSTNPISGQAYVEQQGTATDPAKDGAEPSSCESRLEGRRPAYASNTRSAHQAEYRQQPN